MECVSSEFKFSTNVLERLLEKIFFQQLLVQFFIGNRYSNRNAELISLLQCNNYIGTKLLKGIFIQHAKFPLNIATNHIKYLKFVKCVYVNFYSFKYIKLLYMFPNLKVILFSYIDKTIEENKNKSKAGSLPKEPVVEESKAASIVPKSVNEVRKYDRLMRGEF